MTSEQQDQTNSAGVAVIAVFGVLLANAAAVFLVVRATAVPSDFLVASIMVCIAAVLVDITVIRTGVSARRRRARAARRARERASAPSTPPHNA